MPKRIQSRLAREKHWNSREQSLKKWRLTVPSSSPWFPVMFSFNQPISRRIGWRVFFQGENHRNHFLVNIFPGCPSTAPAPPAARRGLCYRRVVPSALRRCRAWDKLRGREKRWREITIYRLYDIWYDIHDILHVWMLYWWYMMYLYGCISTHIYIHT